MNVFLSHISEEASEARAIKKALESAIPGSEVFVSATDIHFGDQWLKEIDLAMKQAKVVLALCSPVSIRRPWLNFESGNGWAKGLPVIPICYKGMSKDQLPDPLGIFHVLELKDKDSCRQLVVRLAEVLKLQQIVDFDFSQMYQSIKTELPPRSNDIGIVLSHGQENWDKLNTTVFTFSKTLPSGMTGNWTFTDLTDKKAFLSETLHKFSGLIFGSPWDAKLEPETIEATVEWVHKGGRLLLLGYEYGDRHHNANLAELSHHFGIDPCVDIVGPLISDKTKPYGILVNFDISSIKNHPFTEGLKNIQLANVQTLRIEPGGKEWLCVGNNFIYTPTADSVQYFEGKMATPGRATVDMNENAGLPVAVEAPEGLCGEGGVQMIGTWKLIGHNRQLFGGDNIKLLSRLLDWLSRKSG